MGSQRSRVGSSTTRETASRTRLRASAASGSDSRAWKVASDWIPVNRAVVRPQIEKAAAAYAKENNITPRSC